MSRVNIANLNINITASSRNLAPQINQAIQQFSRMTTGVQRQNQILSDSFANFQKILIRSIALYGTFRAATAVKGSLFDSVKLAADAEQAAISFEVLLGSADEAAETIKGLYQFAKESSALQFGDLAEASKLLVATGSESKKLIPTLKMLADISAGTGKNFSELAYLFGTSQSEGRLYTKDLNQFLSAGIPLIEVFTRQFGLLDTEFSSASSQVRQLAEDGKLHFSDLEAAFKSMTSEGGRFFRMTERQAQTATGQWRALGEEVDALKREFGTALLPTLKDAVAAMRELIRATDDGKSSLAAFNLAGKASGDSLRIMAGSVAYANANVVDLQAKLLGVVSIMARMSDVTTGTDWVSGINNMIDSLEMSEAKLDETAAKLFDLKKSIYDLSKPNAGGGSSSTPVDAISDAVTKARNQIKLLTQDARDFADELREKYATPLEEFEAAAKQIIQSNLLGQLSDNELTRFLAAEVDALTAATAKLKKELAENSADEMGSLGAWRAEQMNRNRKDDGAEGVEAIVARLRATAAKELADLKKAADEANPAVDAANESVASATTSVNKFAKALDDATAMMFKGQREGEPLQKFLQRRKAERDFKREQDAKPRDYVAESRVVRDMIKSALDNFLAPVRSGRDGIARGMANRDLSPNLDPTSPRGKEAAENARRTAEYEAANREYARAAAEQAEAAQLAKEREMALRDEALRNATGDSSVSQSFRDSQQFKDYEAKRLAAREAAETERPVDPRAAKEAYQAKVRAEFNKTFDDLGQKLEDRRNGITPQQVETQSVRQEQLDDLMRRFTELRATWMFPENVSDREAATEAFREMGRDRQAGVRAGEKPAPIQPGLMSEFLKQLEDMRRSQTESAGGKTVADPQPDKAASKPNTDKLENTINRTSSIQSTKLERIATAVEKTSQNQAITIVEYAA